MNLANLSPRDKEVLARKFIEEVILPQWKQLQLWGSFTSQTAQIDFGYLGQHLVSLLTGISGGKNRGKGDDLADGSEVKSASCLDAVDTPRWNNVNLGAKLKDEILKKYSQVPHLFFVLLDTTIRGGNILRCRVWCVRPSDDDNFMSVILGWAEENDERSKKEETLKTNLQLHPPRWERGDGNLTTNEMGNLKLPLIYHVEQLDVPGILVMETKFIDLSIINTGISQLIMR